MDTRAFLYFETVCNTHGYSAAAARLGVSKQAVHSAVKALTIELGVELVRSGADGITPTTCGLLLLDCCKRCHESVDTFRRALKTELAHSSGILRVGLLPGVSSYFGKDAISSFAESPGGCEVIVSSDYLASDLERALLDGKEDFAIVLNPMAKGILKVPLVRDWTFLWVNRANALSSKRLIEPRDLEGHRLVALRFEEFGHVAIMDVFARCGIDLELVIADEMIDIFEEAYANHAIGHTTRQHVKRLPTDRVVGIPFSELPLDYYLCYRADRTLSDTEAAFIEYMRRRRMFFRH